MITRFEHKETDHPEFPFTLTTNYAIKTDVRPPKPIRNEYYFLSVGGLLTILEGYSWNGCNDPAVNFDWTMRGSLVHDVFYQMFQLKELSSFSWREAVDVLFKDLIIFDGPFFFGSFIAGVYYNAVRLFGGGYAEPEPEDEPV